MGSLATPRQSFRPEGCHPCLRYSGLKAAGARRPLAQESAFPYSWHDSHLLGRAERSSPRSPQGRRLWRRGLDGESALRTIMANAMDAPRGTQRNGGLPTLKPPIDSGAKHLATHRQPVRHEVVTHVIGTFRYLCLRSGHLWNGDPGRTRTCDQQPRRLRENSLVISGCNNVTLHCTICGIRSRRARGFCPLRLEQSHSVCRIQIHRRNA
jgi:hypothetical protein